MQVAEDCTRRGPRRAVLRLRGLDWASQDWNDPYFDTWSQWWAHDEWTENQEATATTGDEPASKEALAAHKETDDEAINKGVQEVLDNITRIKSTCAMGKGSASAADISDFVKRQTLGARSTPEHRRDEVPWAPPGYRRALRKALRRRSTASRTQRFAPRWPPTASRPSTWHRKTMAPSLRMAPTRNSPAC